MTRGALIKKDLETHTQQTRTNRWSGPGSRGTSCPVPGSKLSLDQLQSD